MRPAIHRSAAAGLLAVLFAVAHPGAFAGPKPEAVSAAALALEWLGGRQFAGGGFGGDPAGPTGGPDPSASADVVFAIVAGDRDAASWRSPSGQSPLSYLETESERYDCDALDHSDCNAGRAAKIALAVSAAGRDPRNFGGNDLLAGLTFGGGPAAATANSFSMGFALLAWAAAGEAVPPELITRALATQKNDGGWTGFSGGSDTNGTFMIAQGLVAARPSAGVQRPMIDDALPRAVEYLAGQQNPDGGFAYTKESAAFCGGPCPSEAASTSGVIQALRAMGEDPGGGRWVKDGPGPVDALLSFRDAGGGFFYTGQPPDTVTTAGAVQGLMERSLVCLAHLGTCPAAAAAKPPADPGPGDPPGAPPADPPPPRPPDGPYAPAAGPQDAAPAAGAQGPAATDPGAALAKIPAPQGAVPVKVDASAVLPGPADPGNIPTGLFPGGGGFTAPQYPPSPAHPVISPAPAEGVVSTRAAEQPVFYAVALAAVLTAILLGRFDAGLSRVSPALAGGVRGLSDPRARIST